MTATPGRGAGRVLTITALLAGSLLAAANAAVAAPLRSNTTHLALTGPVQSAMLRSGEKLAPGQNIYSANGRFKLRMQLDGNLVLLDAGKAIWHTATGRNPGAAAYMQRDGNLVVRSSANVPLWYSGTRSPGATAHVQNDGNLTVRSTSGSPLWARR